MDNFSDKTKSLLVDINEEQIQEQEEVLSEDNGKEKEEIVEKPAVKQTSEHEQIFSDKKPVKKKKNVKFEVVENEVIKAEQGQQPETKPLPMTYRQKKKAEKDAVKAEQKRLKEIEKQKKEMRQVNAIDKKHVSDIGGKKKRNKKNNKIYKMKYHRR